MTTTNTVKKPRRARRRKPKTMTEEELKILAKLQKNQELSKGELMIERLMEEAYSKP